MNSPRITYDPDANALYMRFSDNEIAETLELSESVYVDVEADGMPVGLEVLNASSSLMTGLPGVSDKVTLKGLMSYDAAHPADTPRRLERTAMPPASANRWLEKRAEMTPHSSERQPHKPE